MSRSYNSLKVVLALLHLHVVTVGSNVTVPQNILAICLQHCWVRSVLSLHLLSCSDFLCSLCSRTWFLMGILPSSFILFDLELHYSLHNWRTQLTFVSNRIWNCLKDFSRMGRLWCLYFFSASWRFSEMDWAVLAALLRHNAMLTCHVHTWLSWCLCLVTCTI